MNTQHSGLTQGAVLMLIGALAFVGYAVVFLFRSFTGGGFELGVQTLNGVTRDNLNALNPAIMHYIGHLHVATAGFIAATGIAVAALSWYGVRRGAWWAWIAAVVAPVVGLAVALPYHYTGTFEHNWVTHLGPIYIATLGMSFATGLECPREICAGGGLPRRPASDLWPASPAPARPPR